MHQILKIILLLCLLTSHNNFFHQGISSDFYNPFPEQVIENIRKNRIKPNLLKE